MKLKNKKTGEIVRAEFLNNWQTDDGTEIGIRDCNTNIVFSYNSLAELNEEWEDYEEPKGSALDLMILTLINFIENEPDEDKVDLEDCKQMLEKLKAWKRLKDKGFRFSKDWVYRYDQPFVKNHKYLEFVAICEDGVLLDDLDLLFSGGEE
jgi:hypothetical protein